MDIRGLTIAGIAAVRVRDAFRAFGDLPAVSYENGEFVRTNKQLSKEFFTTELEVDTSTAAALLDELVSTGYVDAKKLTPTPKGMALMNAEDRERLPRAEAEGILQRFLVAVKGANDRPGARVFIEEVSVFGSYLGDAPTLGDIDLLVIMSLPEDCLPEDFDERHSVTESILISEYLSFHDQFDPVAVNADSLELYKR